MKLIEIDEKSSGNDLKNWLVHSAKLVQDN